MRDFTKNLSDEDLMETRGNREATMNRPDIDPSMSDDDDDWGSLEDKSSSDDDWSASFGRDDDDSFSSSDGFGPRGMMGRPSMMGRPGMGGFEDRGMMGRGMMGSDMGGGFSQQYGTPMDNQRNMQGQNPEDVFWGTIAKGAKGSYNFMSEAIKSFKEFDVRGRMIFGRYSLISGLLVGLLSVIGCIAHLNGMIDLLIASLLTAGIGTILFMCSFDTIKQEEANGQYQNNFNNNMNDDSDIDLFGDSEPQDDFNDSDDDFNSFDSEPENEDTDFNDFNMDTDEENEGFKDSGFDYSYTTEEEPKNTDDILDNLTDNTAMMTRQYLFDNMMSAMESQKSNFNEIVKLDEDSRQFLGYCKMVETASQVYAGKKINEVPEVEAIEDGLFFLTIILKKPSWLNSSNVNKFADEIVKQCALDPVTHEIDSSITGTGTCVGTTVYIKIMKNESAIVTVKDTYNVVKDEILNLKKELPVALGIDSAGKVFVTDFNNVPGLIIAGAPRSGKSWCLKSILAQLMMFKRPSELHFYLADPKGLTSDFFTLETPHIKGFTADEFELIKWLDYFCVEEANRRAKILFEAGGYKNLKDFHKDHPEVEMPIIYIVIDEVITFTQRMDKDTRNRFYKYLREFVSRLPGYGINIMIVPHLLKNSVIDKNVTDMLPNRIIVKGGPSEIETILDCKAKEFPYKLNNQGDMGVKIGDYLGFVHNAVISKENSGFERFYQFLTSFWLKVEPESFKGSKLQKDILNGICKRNAYPQITDEQLNDIPENVFNNVKVVSENNDEIEEENVVERPERPKRPRIKKDNTLM